MATAKRYRLWAWGALALFVCIFQAPSFVSSLRPGAQEGMDFFQEWSSAKNWREGLPVYMDLDLAAERYLGRARVPGETWLFARNAHPPAAVLLALPFANLSYPDAMLVWNLLSLAALALSLWLIAKGLGVRLAPWMALPLVVVALLCNPLRQQVNHGQLNLALLLLLVGAWTADRSSRPMTAGALVGTAAAVKMFPGFLLLYFALRGRWRIVLSAIVTLVAVTLLSVAILGVDAWRGYVQEVMPAVSGFRNVWVNASLAGFWSKWFDAGAINPSPALGPVHIPPLAAVPTLAAWGFAVSGLGVLTAWLVAVRRLPDDQAFGLSLTTMLLLSPVTWDHYFLLLLLPVIHLWLAFPEPRWERIALIVVLVPLSLSPLLFVDASLQSQRIMPLIGVSVQFFALSGLFLLGLTPPPTGPRARQRTAIS